MRSCGGAYDRYADVRWSRVACANCVLLSLGWASTSSAQAVSPHSSSSSPPAAAAIVAARRCHDGREHRCLEGVVPEAAPEERPLELEDRQAAVAAAVFCLERAKSSAVMQRRRSSEWCVAATPRSLMPMAPRRCELKIDMNYVKKPTRLPHREKPVARTQVNAVRLSCVPACVTPL